MDEKTHDEKIDEPAPLPAPMDDPDQALGEAKGQDEESDGDHKETSEAHGAPTSLVPKSKAILMFKHHVKISVEGETRKFTSKALGSMELSLLACEEFEKHLKSILSEFELVKRKPTERKALLESLGLDEGILKSSVTSQRATVIRRLCQGKVESVETKITNLVVTHLAHGMNTAGWTVALVGGKYVAKFHGGKRNVEKSFTGLTLAVDWLKSLSLAEKVGCCLKKFGFDFRTIPLSIPYGSQDKCDVFRSQDI